MCDSICSEDPFSIRYVTDQYKSRQTCDEDVNDCLTALKFIPGWFATSKMIKKLITALYADDTILYRIFCNEMGILNVDLYNINLDNKFDEDDPDTVIFISHLAWHKKSEKRKVLKKELNEE